MFACLVGHHQFQALHIGSQIVACVLHIGAYAQLLLSICVIQPVLSLNVKGFLFLCMEGRCQQFDTGRGLQMSRNGYGTE